MQIAIPATSASLYSLFSTDQKTQLRAGRNSANAYLIEIQNTSAQIFYVEKGADAVVGTSEKVDVGRTIQIRAENLNDFNVISASGSINVSVLQLNQ